MTLTNLGILSARVGQAEASQHWLVEGLRLGSDLDYKLIIQYCLIGLGRLAADAGRLVRAARLWAAADAMTQAFGAHLTRAGRTVLDYEARLAAAQGPPRPGGVDRRLDGGPADGHRPGRGVRAGRSGYQRALADAAPRRSRVTGRSRCCGLVARA